MRPRSSKRQPTGSNSPPWRQPLGRAFLRFDSSTGASTDANDQLKYLALLQKTFSAFSDVPVGSDVPIEDLSAPKRIGFEPEWEVDVVPMRGWGEGDQDILYEATGVESPNRAGSRQACWNCLEPGHSYTSCPQPRNHLMVRLSRAKFLAEKEAMPDHAVPYLESYTFTDEERSRRLGLAGKFLPGKVSDALADAVFWIDLDLLQPAPDGVELEDGEVMDEDVPEEVLEIQRLRRRRAWPWLIGMSRWGYPPGWIASKDPIEAVKRHIESLPLGTEVGSDDGEDILQVFGGMGTPSLAPSSPSSTSSTSATSGSDMSLSNDSSSETSISSAHRPSSHLPPPQPSPPPLPPPTDIPSPPRDPPPPPPRQTFPPARRWARYDTDMFDSARLTGYTTVRPLPLGS